jgi:DNA adenine methylase
MILPDSAIEEVDPSTLSRPETKPLVKPFVKWVGGKTQLLEELSRRIPSNFNSYFEPFVGGGALFFLLQPKQCYLSDTNPDLINLYLVVRDQVEELIQDLSKHYYDRDYYYQLRELDRTPEYHSWTAVKRASRMIYLNKSCYNGLYRVNSRGEFNVPFGRFTNPKILDEENLRLCSSRLQGTKIDLADFTEIKEQVGTNDFLYFDPPYVPLSETASFTSYTQGGFDIARQEKLRDLCRELHGKGAQFMLSNSAAPVVLELYAEFKIDFVYAPRFINSSAKRRGKIQEVVVTNYDLTY